METFQETFCWNGITNKRKGQNWGKENQSISWKESRDYDGHPSMSRAVTYQPSSSWKHPKECNTNSPSTWASGRKQQCDASLNFEKLMPLTDLPKVCLFHVNPPSNRLVYLAGSMFSIAVGCHIFVVQFWHLMYYNDYVHC